jgi:hypothetical protein
MENTGETDRFRLASEGAGRDGREASSSGGRTFFMNSLTPQLLLQEHWKRLLPAAEVREIDSFLLQDGQKRDFLKSLKADSA